MSQVYKILSFCPDFQAPYFLNLAELVHTGGASVGPFMLRHPEQREFQNESQSYWRLKGPCLPKASIVKRPLVISRTIQKSV